MAQKTANMTVCYILLVLVSLLCAGPFLWLLSTSLKSNENIYMLRLIPEHPSLEAYSNVFKLLNIGSMLKNSVIIAGASELRIWWSILLPQIRPTVLTVVIMDFINKWNMFLWPLLILDVDQYPVATGMQYISQSFEYKFVNVAAGTVLSALPVIILFIIFQKQYINTTAGAIKG